jgi:hypothetical protein
VETTAALLMWSTDILGGDCIFKKYAVFGVGFV